MASFLFERGSGVHRAITMAKNADVAKIPPLRIGLPPIAAPAKLVGASRK
jgi:hypothetical protein